MAEMPNPDWLSTTEAAAVIGVERSTLTRWRQMGQITAAIKAPGKTGTVLFARAEVERVAAWHKARNPKTAPA